jgi:hypothetical protein
LHSAPSIALLAAPSSSFFFFASAVADRRPHTRFPVPRSPSLSLSLFLPRFPLGRVDKKGPLFTHFPRLLRNTFPPSMAASPLIMSDALQAAMMTPPSSPPRDDKPAMAISMDATDFDFVREKKRERKRKERKREKKGKMNLAPPLSPLSFSLPSCRFCAVRLHLVMFFTACRYHVAVCEQQ